MKRLPGKAAQLVNLSVDHPQHDCLSTSPFQHQLSGRPQGLHEERMPGALLPGEAGHPLSLTAPGDLSAETCAEDLEVPPSATGLYVRVKVYYT